jgi:hypothetical protein
MGKAARITHRNHGARLWRSLDRGELLLFFGKVSKRVNRVDGRPELLGHQVSVPFCGLNIGCDPWIFAIKQGEGRRVLRIYLSAFCVVSEIWIAFLTVCAALQADSSSIASANGNAHKK